MNKWWLLGGAGVAIIIGASFVLPLHVATAPRWDDVCVRELVVNTQKVLVCVADTLELRERGLSNTPNLAPGKGMLFVFDEPGKYGFWMKDMKYALDIIWLDDNLKEIYRARAVTPESFPQVFRSDMVARYVLETNPGEILQP